MKQPQQLKTTKINSNLTVSSIFVPTGTEGGYFETMLFINNHLVAGLEAFETMSKYDSWEENHEALAQKALDANDAANARR